ncbi:MAG: nucleoside hydrolase [Rhodoglobus sp.]|nr:nucleoside hydrolase [Rhodoglobus sp.]
MTTSLLLDVDTGVDDALALLFVAMHPELNLRAVTCVAGNTHVDQVVRNTLDVLHAAGHVPVPVARGAERPLIEPPRSADEINGANGLGGIVLPTSPHAREKLHAVELLRKVISESTEPLTLLALGPLTNAALLLRMYPDDAAKLERIVFMGGSASIGNASAVAEFNVWHDPEAAAIVLDAPVPVAMYGLDVFTRVVVGAADYSRMRESTNASTRLAGELLEFSARVHATDSTLDPGGLIGDAGAACFVAEPALFGSAMHPTTVELGLGRTRGQTIVDRRGMPGEADTYGDAAPSRSVEVALTVDSAAVSRLFLQTISGSVAR